VLAGLVSAAALALAAVPGEAAVPPTATTGGATAITATSATLNGLAGPGVAAGPVTTYFFQYGKTTGYGAQTRPGIVTGCPSGTTNPAYCTPAVAVKATIRGLKSGQTYHFRIVSSNADGISTGDDETFTTLSVVLIKSVRLTPATVGAGHTFIVSVSLSTRSHVNISLLSHGTVLKSFNEGVRTGTVRQSIKAPAKKGGYTVRVKASANGANQTVNRILTVT